MTRIKICKEDNCTNAGVTAGYCRLHYLRHWKNLKKKKDKVAADKLNRYIEFVSKKNPDNYMDVIKKDIRSSNFESRYGSKFDEPESIDKLFDNPEFREEIEGLVKDIKVDTDF